LLQIAPLNNSRHLVDVGGGDGTNAIAFANRFPKLRVSIFDSPSVCEIAKHNIEVAGLTDRVDTVPGEIFSDPLPNGIDSILFSHMFTIWSAETNRALLAKIYDSLEPSGKLLIFNMMANDDDSGPISTALGSPYFLSIATGEGMLYSWKDYESWLEKIGFSRIDRIEGLPLDHGLLIATK
jgi:methyltransferase